MSRLSRTHYRALTAIAVLAITLLTACGVSGSPGGELAENQQILANCPDRPPASLVEIDGTGSSASDQITAERMAIVESIVRTTAICGGRLRVLVFSATSAGTTTLFDAPLQLHGATANARLKRVPRLVDETMTKIREVYEPAVVALPEGGSDITAQYRLASEWIGQVGGDHRLELTLLTDGFQTVDIKLNRRLTKEHAEVLANQVHMPKLPGATVIVAGLGHVAGTPPPSRVVEGLITFYDALCARSGATKCTSVTDYAQAGR